MKPMDELTKEQEDYLLEEAREMKELGKCRKCGYSDGWCMEGGVCINQSNIEVEVKCNHLGCDNRELVFIDISSGRIK